MSGWKPYPPLKLPAAPSLSEWAVTSVASRSIVTRSGRTPSAHACSRARACALRRRSSPSGSEAIASITRNAVESEATSPNSGAWSRTARRSARQSPPSQSITQRSRTTRPGSWRERRWRSDRRPLESARVSPAIVGYLGEQCTAGMGDQSVSVRRDFYGETAAITLHPQGDPPELGLRPSTTAESLLSRTKRRPGESRGAYLGAGSGLVHTRLLPSELRRLVGR